MPITIENVSKAIKSLTTQGNEQPKFAIRGGGHANWAGASNIDGGIVIDLRALKSVQLNPSKSTVSVGTGASWDDVYATLDPLGLSVNGGRAADVGELITLIPSAQALIPRSWDQWLNILIALIGVGGLTLGGGISYFSPRYGWTCDTVTNFEIVLADASIVQANTKSNPDLFHALKGGNNNFGVVTRIDVTTFKQGLLWAGTVYNSLDVVDDVISEFVRIGSPDAYDQDASFITTFGFSQAQGRAVISNQLEYAKPVEPPSIYKGFLALPNLLSTSQLVNTTTLAKATRALQPEHPRTLSRVSTFVLTPEVLKSTYVQWNASLSSISQVANIIWGIALEPLPPGIYARHAKDNALGLENRKGSFVVALLTASWTDPSNDALVVEAANNLLKAINTEAKKLGDLDPFVYLNYAGKDQDPIRSYGAASVAQLQTVRKRVDPKGVFTSQVPGGFKIPPKANV
ncbi:hypothetical protein TruAng_004594 [Truncatella angustata]|nr:hypothetical protein TruAng_004594 [Truncatella angustata]